MRRLTRSVVAALAAALALQAHAQAGTTPPAANAPPAGGAPGNLDPNAKETIDLIHVWAVQTDQLANLGQERGSAPKVKELATKMHADAVKMDQEAIRLAQQRGVTLTQATSAQNAPSQQQTLAMLRSHSGADFDQVFAKTLADERAVWVDRLKALRGRTSDKDAELKHWVDTVENMTESQSQLAFAARSDAREEVQRQGRTPPPAR